jgi:agmatinase
MVPEKWPDSGVPVSTMFKVPSCADIASLDADVAFLGVPFDQGTTNRPGTRFGPGAIRNSGVYNYYGYLGDMASRPTAAAGYFDIDTHQHYLYGLTMADCGDVNVVPSGVELTYERVKRSVSRILDRRAFPIILGGDHGITYPVLQAFSEFKSVDIVHFDAHMDYVHDYQGIRFTHGSPIRRCAELSFVNEITSIGVRVARQEPFDDAIKRGNRILSADRFRELGATQAIAQVPRSDAIYVTIDIDVLNPAEAPGTGTPVVGGLTYLELREAIRRIPTRGRVVGLDLVEVSPPYDVSEQTSRLAGQLILDFLTSVWGEDTRDA